MSDLVVNQLRRQIDEAVNRQGMVVGLPKVTLDASHANMLLLVIDRLTAENEKLREALRKAPEPSYDALLLGGFESVGDDYVVWFRMTGMTPSPPPALKPFKTSQITMRS